MESPVRPEPTTSRSLQSYFPHSASYREIVSPDVPWRPSPVTPAPELPPRVHRTKTDSVKSKQIPRELVLQWDATPPHSNQPQRRSFLRLLLPKFMKKQTKNKVQLNIQFMDPSELDPPPKPPIPLSDWKAWGNYAYPIVNGVCVPNATPAAGRITLPPDFSFGEMFSRLRSPGRYNDDNHHPEMWIEGSQHPSLPPRPERWKRPVLGVAEPFPWECQLNPLLEYKDSEATPVLWDLSAVPTYSAKLNVTDTILLTSGDRAQPATWPFISHLSIDAVTEDPRTTFPWKIHIQNDSGVLVEDVFDGIYEEMKQFVTPEEFDTWPPERQDIALAALEFRCYTHRCEPLQGLRRFDFYGSRPMFGGLEPNPCREDGNWIMHIMPGPALGQEHFIV